MEPAKHSCVRMHRQARENLKPMSELSDSRMREGGREGGKRGAQKRSSPAMAGLGEERGVDHLNRLNVGKAGNKTLTGIADAATQNSHRDSAVTHVKRWRQSLRRHVYRA